MDHHSQRPTWELESHTHDSGLFRVRGLASKEGCVHQVIPYGALVPLDCLCQEAGRQGEGQQPRRDH